MEEVQSILDGTFIGDARIETGIYDQATAYVRSTWLKAMNKSAAHCYHVMTTPMEEPSTSLLIGQALHAFVFEPDLFGLKVAKRPDVDGRTKSGAATLEAFKAEHEGSVILRADDYETVLAMGRKVLADPNVKGYLAGGMPEHSFFWEDASTGVKCKARYDWVDFNRGLFLDLKSTEDASLDGFERSIARFGYAMQAAMYSSGFLHVADNPIRERVFVAVEKEPPYEVGVYRLNDAAFEKGQHLYRIALEYFAECRARGEWPGYTPIVRDIGLPSWAF